MVNCPECVSREVSKKRKQLEADFKAEEQEEGFEFRAPPYREMEDEIDFEGLGLIMKLDPATKHFICKRCGLYACLLYTSPSPRDQRGSRMPSSA